MKENGRPDALAAIQILEQCKHRITATLLDAETLIVQVNQVLDSLTGLGRLQPSMLLGDIIYEPRTSQGIGTGRLLQAAIGLGHGGIGVVLWRANAYEDQLRSSFPDFAPSGVKFSNYSECPAELRRLLLPFLSPLLDRVVELARQ